MVAIIILLVAWAIVFGILFFILKTVAGNKLSLKAIRNISFYGSGIIVCVSGFLYIKSTIDPTDALVADNFKFEKLLSKKSPDFLDNNKVEETVYVFFSADIKNNEDDLKKFRLSAQTTLDNFNNMGSFKSISTIVSIYDSTNTRVEFDDIKLFRKDEKYKIYGCMELKGKEEMKWMDGKIPFEPNIQFKISAGTAKDDYKYAGRDIIGSGDIAKLVDFIRNTPEGNDRLLLEYGKGYNNLIANPWAEKMKKRGIKEPGKIAIFPQDMIEYVFGN